MEDMFKSRIDVT